MNEVQNSLRDGVILFRALLDELRRSWESEREGINAIYTTLNETIKKQYDVLLEDLERYSKINNNLFSNIYMQLLSVQITINVTCKLKMISHSNLPVC